MNYLIDVNVWVALALAGHVHHAAARAWFEDPDPQNSESTHLLFCRVTQKGFLRLLTNAKVMGENVLTSAGAWRYYDALCEDDRVRFAPEPAHVENLWREATLRHSGGSSFWTDAYLGAFAATSGLTIVTLDRAFRQVKGAPVHLLPNA
jgi:uncharacterized protein